VQPKDTKHPPLTNKTLESQNLNATVGSTIQAPVAVAAAAAAEAAAEAAAADACLLDSSFSSSSLRYKTASKGVLLQVHHLSA